jgi:hypothetical protein
MTEQMLPPGSYTLTGPGNEVVFRGTFTEALELLPDTQARRQAAEEMHKMKKYQLDAEAAAQEAEAKALQLVRAAGELIARCEAYVSNCEAREQERHDAEEQEAERQAEEQEAARLAAIASQLAPIIGPDGEHQVTPDDGDLEANPPVDKERFNPEHEPVETDDQEPVKPILSYANTPMSYIKKDEDLQPGHDPQPSDPTSPGAIDIPSPHPEPGSRLYQHPPQIAQPVSISLNEEYHGADC